MNLEDLKISHVAVGIKETHRALEKQNVKCVFIASDCDEFMTQSVRELCECRQIPVISAFVVKFRLYLHLPRRKLAGRVALR